MTVGGRQKRPRSQEIVVKDDVVATPNNPPPVIHISQPPRIVVEDENYERKKCGGNVFHGDIFKIIDPPTANGEADEEKKEPITALSFTPTLYIPEYFGLVSH